jgi:hypothetical protein
MAADTRKKPAKLAGKIRGRFGIAPPLTMADGTPNTTPYLSITRNLSVHRSGEMGVRR